MGLTDEESKVIFKTLGRYEKSSRQLRWARWVALLGAAIIFTGAGWHVYRWADITSNTRVERLSANPKSAELVRAIAGEIEDTKHAWLEYTKFVLALSGGAALLCVITVQWNKWREYAIFSKLIREYLHDKYDLPLPGQNGRGV